MNFDPLKIKREDIGHCLRCDLSPEGVEFRGRLNRESVCSHFKSSCGWWLRIDHRFDIEQFEQVRLPDKVGELMCPDCSDKHSEMMKELF